MHAGAPTLGGRPRTPAAPASRQRAGRRRELAGVLALLVVALAVRVGVIAATPGYAPTHDDKDYDRIAWSIARGGGYPPSALHLPGGGKRFVADAYRPPGWPAALAAAYAVAGHHWLAGRLLGAALGALAVLALAWVALRLLGRRAAWIAGAIAAVYLPFALVSSSLVSETLFVLLELLSLALALESRRAHGGRRVALAAAAGAVVGLASLTRVNGFLMLLAVLPLAAAGLRRDRRRALSAAVVALVAFAVVLAPWTIRNARVLHAFVPVSTETGNTVSGTYNRVAASDPAAPWSWHGARRSEYKPLLHRGYGPVQLDRALTHAALRYVADHPAAPLAAAAYNLRRWLELAGGARARFEAGTIGVPGGWADAGRPFAWALAALGLAGLAAGGARRTPAAFWLAPLALLATTLAINAETPRFRAPLDPIFILLAAGALARLAGRRVRR